MEGSSEGERDAPDGRGTWFAQRLDEGWTEVEPGIYRFDTDPKNQAAIRMGPPSKSAPERDRIERLNPAEGQPDRPPPARRFFGRRVRT